MACDPHRIGELRSLAYHRVVADRLDERLIQRARDRVAAWNASVRCLSAEVAG